MRVLLAPSQVPTNYPKYWEKLQFPIYGSPKLDGIRAVVDQNGTLKSRTWKDIPSYQAQEEFNAIPWVDGELIEGNETDFDVYNRTQSHVMSENKPGNLTYHLFDYPHPDWRHFPFERRLEQLHTVVLEAPAPEIYRVVPQKILMSVEDVLEFEQEMLKLGYEGVMLKTPHGKYKEGRATINEGIIYKLKRFLDAEGPVVRFVERETNNNPQERDERGYAKRSSSKTGKTPAGTLGKFKVEFEGREISVAPGTFTHPELQEIWDNREAYLGRLLKFKYFAHGVKDDPRHARAIGWRDAIDV